MSPEDILGVLPDATADEIRAAYRDKARALHPDQSSDDNAEESFKSLNQAYRTLLQRAGEPVFTKPPTWEEFFAGLGGLVKKAKKAARGKRGSDMCVEIAVPFVEAITGSTRRVTLPQATVTFPIPAGTKDGRKLRISERGHPFDGEGGRPGDLVVVVRVTPDPTLSLVGDDVVCALPITAFEAAMGATVDVPTLEGVVKLKVPAGSQPGTEIRIAGAGPGGSGDQVVRLDVEIPVDLDEHQLAALRELAEKLPADVHPVTMGFRDKPDK